MAIEFGKQFTADDTDLVYKGVRLQQAGRLRKGHGHTPTYSFTYWWNAPTSYRHGQNIDENTPRQWQEEIEPPLPLVHAKKMVNRYLEQGFSVHPNGHLRAPGWTEKE